MGAKDDPASEIAEFVKSYEEVLASLCRDANEIFIECFSRTGRNNPDDYFITIGEHMKVLMSFADVKVNISKLRQAKTSLVVDFCSLMHGKDVCQKKLTKFETKVDQFINKIHYYQSRQIGKVENIYDNIKECRHGEQENNTRNALSFQNEVLCFIDWLFMAELKRMDLREIEDGSQRRDGGYEVVEGFDTEGRCGFQFHNIFIECKNYKKPSYHDLMQLFSYTLHCVESKVFSVPLSILISRENPVDDSATAKFRRLIFNRRIDREERLVLFLDDKDLGEMLKLKKNGGDPAHHLKDKVKAFGRRTMKE